MKREKSNLCNTDRDKMTPLRDFLLCTR